MSSRRFSTSDLTSRADVNERPSAAPLLTRLRPRFVRDIFPSSRASLSCSPRSPEVVAYRSSAEAIVAASSNANSFKRLSADACRSAISSRRPVSRGSCFAPHCPQISSHQGIGFAHDKHGASSDSPHPRQNRRDESFFTPQAGHWPSPRSATVGSAAVRLALRRCTTINQSEWH
jgi:hypothetical protein